MLLPSTNHIMSGNSPKLKLTSLRQAKTASFNILPTVLFTVIQQFHTNPVPSVFVTWTLLTTWSRVFQKLTGSKLVKKFPRFYGTRRFLTAFTSAHHPHYPQPDQSSPWPPSHFLKIQLNIILPLTPGSSKWCLSFRFPTKTLYAPLPHAWYMPRPSHAPNDSKHSPTSICS